MIRNGDTLVRIAWEYNTTVQDVMIANPGINSNNLQAGRFICVPLKSQLYPSCPTENYYVVVKGDTLESIAVYFNIPYLQLTYLNYGAGPHNLHEGQILTIPAAPSPVMVEANITERSLTVFRNEKLFRIYVIAPENPDCPIPRESFAVQNKQVNPGGRYGIRWISLSEDGFGIHGTGIPNLADVILPNRAIVMSNQDVSELFNLVPVGTPVKTF
jgi:LysM repeat protein